MGIDIRASIEYQLAQLTDEQAALFCEIIEWEPVLTAKELAERWDEWSLDGLTALLTVRFEDEYGPE